MLQTVIQALFAQFQYTSIKQLGNHSVEIENSKFMITMTITISIMNEKKNLVQYLKQVSKNKVYTYILLLVVLTTHLLGCAHE